MNALEQGFLLLSSNLGVPGRRVLTVPQLRQLAQRVQQMPRPDREGALTQQDLLSLGYSREMSRRILVLLEDGDLLEYYLNKGRMAGCVPVTRVSEAYPLQLRKRLGLDSPGVLWAKGDLSLFHAPRIALVGSRQLREENRAFAWQVGCCAARQGYVLVSGNARGADQTAQNACLEAGGKVISVVSDSLADHTPRENVLYLSENSFDEAFSAQRAISRNRVIHALGEKTFVAQSDYQTGGTWDGTVKNLRFGWSRVYCYADGSPAQRLLSDMGADTIDLDALTNISALPGSVGGLLEEEV